MSPDEPGLSLAGIVPSGIASPGTFRWIFDDDHLRELLVINAHLMPVKFVRFAKNAFKTFVFPDKHWRPITELMTNIEDDLIWTSGNWPQDELAKDAVSARVPAGFFRDVCAVARNGDKVQRQRSLAMALMIASALLRPLQAAGTDVNKELDHDEFQRLVDEAGAELCRARAVRLVDDEFEWHITVEAMDERPAQDNAEEEASLAAERRAEESDSECVPYEEYRTRKDGEKGEKKDDDRMSGSSGSQWPRDCMEASDSSENK